MSHSTTRFCERLNLGIQSQFFRRTLAMSIGCFCTIGSLERQSLLLVRTSVGAQSAETRMAAALRAEDGMAAYEKGSSNSIFDRLLDRLPIATVNAVRALDAATAEQEMNPSTKLHLLILEFQRLGVPTLAVAPRA